MTSKDEELQLGERVLERESETGVCVSEYRSGGGASQQMCLHFRDFLFLC